MNLIQLLVLVVLFLIGTAVGAGISLVHPISAKIPIELVLGLMCILLFAWPIYRRLGLMPRPPKCPRPECGEREYIFISQESDGAKWKCKRCGQLVLLKGETVVVLGDNGEPLRLLGLRRPKILGIWKPI
jgi:hypothetical protein